MRKRHELRTIGTLMKGIVGTPDPDTGRDRSDRHDRTSGALSLSEAMAAHDPEQVDRALMAALPASIAVVCRERWTERVTKHGWNGELTGYEVVTRPSRSELAAAAVLVRTAMTPAPLAAIKQELMLLYAATLSREAEKSDAAPAIAAMARALARYPADIAIEACRYWTNAEKSWPGLDELRARMEATARPRRLLAIAIHRARKPQARRQKFRRQLG